MNDLVNLAMRRAVKNFGGSDKVFNSAGFGVELSKLANFAERGLDGNLVEVILCGRPDVERLTGGAHFRLIETQPSK